MKVDNAIISFLQSIITHVPIIKGPCTAVIPSHERE